MNLQGCHLDSLECQLLAAGFRSRDDYKFNTTADRAELVQDLMQEISKPRAKAVVKRQRSHRRTHMKRSQKICGLRWRAKRIPTLRSKNRSLHIFDAGKELLKNYHRKDRN